MRLRSVVTVCLVFAALIGTLSLTSAASANSPQESTSISFTVTTTTNYQVTTGGQLLVNFNSVQLTFLPPEAYGFGIDAKTSSGSWITNLHWEFGDGAVLDSPYCCQSQVSEVRYHSYANPGSYTVAVTAYDNAGRFGDALVTVNWPDPVTPVPEYPTYAFPLFISLAAVIVAVAYRKSKLNPVSMPLR